MRFELGLAALVLCASPLLAAIPPPTLLGPANLTINVAPQNVSFSWNLNPASDGIPLSSYLVIKQADESWDPPHNPGDLGSRTSYTISLQPGTAYKWSVAAVDWSRRSNPWYQWSETRTFVTAASAQGPTGGSHCSNLPITTYFSKPLLGLRDYNSTYAGAPGTGSIGYQGGTLYRDNYTSGSSGYEGIGSHPGVDIPVSIGTDVYSVSAGCVELAQPNDGWGNVIIVRSLVQGLSEPAWFIYAHLSQGFVAVGQIVYPGTRIGLSGNTGSSTGPHLHFQADRESMDSRGQQQVQHPWFPTMIGRAVNTPDSDGAVSRYTYNPLYLIQGQTAQQNTPTIQISFNPNPVSPSPDLNYHYTVTIKNPGQQGITLTKMTVGPWDATQYISQWFGTTSLGAGDSRNVNINHPVGLKDWTVWSLCGNVSGGQSGLCWNASISLR